MVLKVRSSTPSIHVSLGQPYTPSLPDDSSDVDSLRINYRAQMMAAVYTGSSIHCVPVTLVP